MSQTTTLTASQVADKVADVTSAMKTHIANYKGRAHRIALIADEDGIPLESETNAYLAAASRAHGALRVLQIIESSTPSHIVSRLKLAVDAAIRDGNADRTSAVWEAYVYFTTDD